MKEDVFKRILELNHKIHAEEVAAGLWDKKGKKKRKKKNETSILKEPKTNYGQEEMFGCTNHTTTLLEMKNLFS